MSAIFFSVSWMAATTAWFLASPSSRLSMRSICRRASRICITALCNSAIRWLTLVERSNCLRRSSIDVLLRGSALISNCETEDLPSTVSLS